MVDDGKLTGTSSPSPLLESGEYVPRTAAKKSANMTAFITWMSMLGRIQGVSMKKARAIALWAKSPKLLVEASAVCGRREGSGPAYFFECDRRGSHARSACAA